MRPSSLRSAAVLALLGPAAAQQTFLVPAGFALDEGDSEAFETQPFFAANARFQYVDGGQRGTPRPTVNKLELRRRPTELAGLYPARTTSLTVVLAHTAAATLSTTFAANYKGGLATQVLGGAFALPDLGPGPLPLPAPWGVVVPFTAAFAYNGSDDLLVELRCQGTSPVGQAYPLDCVRAAALADGYSWYNGQRSCTTPNGSFLIYAAPGMPSSAGGLSTFAQHALGGPSSAAAVLLLGVGQLASDFGGLVCAPIQPTLDVTIPVTTGPTGAIGSAASPVAITFPTPQPPLLVFAQFVAIDLAQAAPLSVALSDDIKWRIGALGPYAVTRISATSATTAPPALVSGTLATTYVPVMRLTY